MFVYDLFLVADLHYTVLPNRFDFLTGTIAHTHIQTLSVLSRVNPVSHCVGTYLSEFMEIKCRWGHGRKFSDLCWLICLTAQEQFWVLVSEIEIRSGMKYIVNCKSGELYCWSFFIAYILKNKFTFIIDFLPSRLFEMIVNFYCSLYRHRQV